MDSTALIRLTAAEASAAMQRRQTTSVSLVEAMLERIASVDDQVRAWEWLDAEGALAEARRADSAIQSGDDRALAGIPVGIKDIIDVRGMPTGCGYPGLASAVPARDAWIVARLKAKGAIVLGKMVTTQFAWMDPSRTRNPWALDHTPGGSSSGPAAGVAAGTVPIAIGTQTGGSLLRPASFTGIVGFKPTRGRISLRGVHLLAPSLDHVGVLAKSVDDCRLFLTAAAASRAVKATRAPDRPSIALLDDCLEPATPDVRQAILTVAVRASDDGGRVDHGVLPVSLEAIASTHRTVMISEAATVHGDRFAKERDLYLPGMTANLEAGLRVAAHQYLQAKAQARRISNSVRALLTRYDLLLLPTSAQTAPALNAGITGDPLLQLPGSLTGLPAISLPCGRDAQGMPIGVQLIGGPGQDEQLLTFAAWLERLIPPLPWPIGLDAGRLDH